MKDLNQKLALIQTKLKAKKSSYNSFGKYYFRKAEDILEAIKPFLIENGVSVTMTEEVVGTNPVPMLQSSAIISDGKQSITATAIVGVDLNQKGMQTSQQFGAASTYGKKYALGNLFLIDDTEDADATNKHGNSKKMDHSQLNAAKQFVAKGGSIAAIKNKYDLSSVQYEILKNVKTNI